MHALAQRFLCFAGFAAWVFLVLLSTQCATAVGSPITNVNLSRNCNPTTLGIRPATPANQVQYIYCLFFGNTTDLNGISFYSSALSQNLITIQQIMNAGFTSREFNQLFDPSQKTPDEFVTMLYEVFLFRAPDAGELANAVARLQSNTVSQLALFNEFITWPEFKSKNAILFGVDATSLNYKFLFGYQGWFSAIGDGDPYSTKYNTDIHWALAGSGLPGPTNVTVDMWPDTTAYDADELYPTAFTLPNGQNAQAYTAYSAKTVNRHFQWMQQYGIDGAVLQRFVRGYAIGRPELQQELDQVAANVRAAAEANGRVFCVELDTVSETTATVVNDVVNQWKLIVDTLKLTQSPNYLVHNGKPVVFIAEFGAVSRAGTATVTEALQIINWLETAPAPYGATVVGATPVFWRTLGVDVQPDPGWAHVFLAYDVISPWLVGQYRTTAGVDANMKNIQGDIAYARANNIGYMPVIFPGFSASNLYRLRNQSVPLNIIPRNGGNFWWYQLNQFVGNGVTTLFGAMFDEVDEATAMYKIAPQASDVPNQPPAHFVTLDIDGYNLPSDWYLRLAGMGTQVLRGWRPMTSAIPGSTGFE